MPQNIESLNNQFVIPNHLTIEPGMSDLPVININNEHARATIALLGAHITGFQPHGQSPVLFMSEASEFREGTPIRGGIPICWPWFGPHQNPDYPMHGLARTRSFQLAQSTALDNGSTQVTLTLKNSDQTQPYFPQPFTLQLIVTVGTELTIELVAQHQATHPITITNALHTYFQVGNVGEARILGLENSNYIDKMDDMKSKTQLGPVTIDAETDRVYQHQTEAIIEDPTLARRIRINKTGSASTVVWNPWVDKAKAMADFGDNEFPTMLCVETANALQDSFDLPPNTEHRMTTTITVEPIT